MHQYKIMVTFNNSPVQVYPKRNESGANFEDVCKRVGMMVMAEDITDIVVWRDDQEYRVCQVEQKEG